MYRLSRRIRSDNGSEFTAQNVQRYLEQYSLSALHIAPGSPWQNGHVECFNHKIRDELLNLELFYTLKEAKYLIEKYRLEYNDIRPHSRLNDLKYTQKYNEKRSKRTPDLV